MDEKKYIVIKGARENNLKDITLSLPKEKLIVFPFLGFSTIKFRKKKYF